MKTVIAIATVLLTSSTAFAGYNWSSTPDMKTAVVGGAEMYRNSKNGPTLKRKLYICRATYKNGMHPGKLVAGKCNISWGGKEITSRRYQLLQSKQGLFWANKVTPNAVIGGRENGKPLYICQTSYQGGTHPGKIVGGMCHIGYAGKEIFTKNFRVLTNRQAPPATGPIQWVQFNGKYPRAAVIGGRERGKALYVCRTRYKGLVQPGKVVKNMCHISYGGREVYTKKFQVLAARVALRWVNQNGPGVIVGGKVRNQNLLVCRAAYKGATHPGKVANGKCIISWGGKALAFTRFDYLRVASRISAATTSTQPPANVPTHKWIQFNGRIPRSALAAGFEGRNKLYVCRTAYKGGVHPGKIWKSMCHIGYGGKEIYTKKFQVLVQNKPLRLAKRVTAKAIVGGQERGRKLLMCVGKHKGGMHPGKIVAGNCNIGYGGKEIITRNFLVISNP